MSHLYSSLNSSSVSMLKKAATAVGILVGGATLFSGFSVAAYAGSQESGAAEPAVQTVEEKRAEEDKQAAQREKERRDKFHESRAWSIQMENDVFSQFLGLKDSDSDAPDFDGDKDYTQGIRLGLTIRDAKDMPFHGLIDSLPMMGGVKGEELHLTYQVFLGQNIYTPTDITRTDVQLDDRPYAGWLYFGSTITRQTGRDLESLELDVGIIGPMSGAQQVQSAWHSLINTRSPEGWDNQLNNEPAFSLLYTRARNISLMKETDGKGLGMDITPHGTMALGTVYTHLSVGATVRLGTGLDRELMTPNRVQPSLPGSDIFKIGGFDFYGYSGFEVRAVARNAFLDGNLFSDSHSVAKKHFVADASLGVVAFNGEWRFAYSHVFRSDEFKGQGGGHYYGSFSVSKLF